MKPYIGCGQNKHPNLKGLTGEEGGGRWARPLALVHGITPLQWAVASARAVTSVPRYRVLPESLTVRRTSHPGGSPTPAPRPCEALTVQR